MPAEATLRDYVNATGYTTVEIDDEGILLDVDTPADYDMMRARMGVRDGADDERR
jgi:CTP:molybdopterin cytidylyltransferase MocA